MASFILALGWKLGERKSNERGRREESMRHKLEERKTHYPKYQAAPPFSSYSRVLMEASVL